MSNKDFFAETAHGQYALALMGSVPEGFRFYKMERLGKPPNYSDCVRLTGAVFREATRGPYKGQARVKVVNTDHEVYVTDTEVERVQKGALP